MKNGVLVFSWIFGFLFFVLFLLSVFSHHYLPSIFALIITVFLFPPARKWMSDATGGSFPLWLRSVAIPMLLFLFIFVIFQGMGNKYSIYKNPEIGKKLMTIYENRMAKWPVPYESRYINTQCGKIYVITSGAEEAPPILLLHALSLASWSLYTEVMDTRGV